MKSFELYSGGDKVNCPFCKSVIPADALRCSHCTADLSSKNVRDKIDDQLKAHKKKMRDVLIFVLGLIGIFVFFILLISSGSKNLQVNEPPAVNLSIGAEAVVRSSDDPEGLSFLATSKEDFDQVRSAIIARDVVGLLELASEGRVFGVTNGARIKIVDMAVGLRRVRVIKGVQPVDEDKIGSAGWVPKEWIVAN